MTDRNVFRGNFRNQSYERNRSRSYDRQTRGNNRRDNRSISNSRSRSGSRVVQIEIALDVLSAKSTIILQETVQQHKHTER